MVSEGVGDMGTTPTASSESTPGEKSLGGATAGGTAKKRRLSTFEAAKCPRCLQMAVKVTTREGVVEWLDPRVRIMIVAELEDGETRVLEAPAGKIYASHQSMCFSPEVLRSFLKKRGIFK